MKRAYLWFRVQPRPLVSKSSCRTRKFELLEARFCYSTSGISTDWLWNPVADVAQVATLDRVQPVAESTTSDEVDTKSREINVDQQAPNSPREAQETDQYHDEASLEQNTLQCIDDEDESPDDTTFCESVSTITYHAGPITASNLIVQSDTQTDEGNEPEKATSGPAVAGVSNGQFVQRPQLQPVEQLNIGPAVTPNPQGQSIVVFRTMDNRQSQSLESHAVKLKTPQAAEQSTGPGASDFASVALKQTIQFKPTLFRNTSDLRPQLSTTPSIMPKPFKIEAPSVESKLEPQVAVEHHPVFDVEIGEVSKLKRMSDVPAADTRVVGESMENPATRKHLLVGAIVAGWIATPRRALGRLVGNIQARVGGISSRHFRRDKSNSNRPIPVEEANL